jgi:hypothetical protein
VEQLEADLGTLDPERSGSPTLDVVYLYSSREAGRLHEAERVVVKQRATSTRRECWSCYKACTHCQASTGKSGGHGGDNPVGADLIKFARDDKYDWAIVISADLRLIPVVRFVQSRGRKIIHGCFPPVAMDLTRECWASIDLRTLNRVSADPPRTSP